MAGVSFHLNLLIFGPCLLSLGEGPATTSGFLTSPGVLYHFLAEIQ